MIKLHTPTSDLPQCTKTKQTMKFAVQLFVCLAVVNLAAGLAHVLTGHYLHRRQLLPTDMNGGVRCFTESVAAQCQSGIQQEEINILQQCGLTNLSELSAGECSRNEVRQYCTPAVYELIEAGIFGYYDQFCDDAIASGQCSSACSTILQDISAYGCCLNTAFNNSFSLDDLLSYQLWTLCNVGTLDFCSSDNGQIIPPAGSGCTNDELTQQLLELLCCSGGPVVEHLLKQDCPDLAQLIINQCGRRNGKFCLEDSEIILQASSVPSSCSSTTSTCQSTCATALRSYRDTAGCCLNNLLNNTFQPNPITDFELWDRCNVDAPDFCPSTLGATTVHERVLMLTLAFALLSSVF